MVTPKDSLAYQPKPEVAEKKLNGLCLNCMHNTDCIYAGNGDVAILECAEYAYEPGTNLKIHHTDKQEPEPQTGVRLMGLCMNCALRETCTLPKAEAGVWHCEEYL